MAMKVEFEWLPITKIGIDHQFQRELRPHWVRKLSEEFDPDKFGSITVSRRGDGTLIVLDGQHRLEVAREILGADQMVPSLVYDGLTVKREAEIFKGENHRLGVSALDDYHASLTAEEPWAVRLHELLEDGGYVIGKGKQNIKCISALKFAFDYGCLDNVVKVLHGAWPYTPWQAVTVRALTAIYVAAPHVDTGRLVTKLHATAEDLLVQRGRKVTEGEREAGRRTSYEAGVAEVMVRLYNHSLRTAKIKRPPQGWPAIATRSRDLKFGGNPYSKPKTSRRRKTR